MKNGDDYMDRIDAVKRLLEARKKYYSIKRDCEGTDARRQIWESDDRMYDILDELEEPTIEEVVDKLSDQSFALSDNALEAMSDGIDATESPELTSIATIWILWDEDRREMMEIDVVTMFGEAYGKLGIPVEELPEIGIKDTLFLEGYLREFPIDERNIIKEEDPGYEQVMKLFDLVKRKQMQLNLRKEKQENEYLTQRAEAISEAENATRKADPVNEL